MILYRVLFLETLNCFCEGREEGNEDVNKLKIHYSYNFQCQEYIIYIINKYDISIANFILFHQKLRLQQKINRAQIEPLLIDYNYVNEHNYF